MEVRHIKHRIDKKIQADQINELGRNFKGTIGNENFKETEAFGNFEEIRSRVYKP